ncbi:hypothetical protein F5887DRAFT_77578 [Amanita rubescens]|nr:hypothetical protein F5887DRAFT_77578 [Amanita rubescens]
MFTTVRSNTMSGISSSRPAQNAQKKYYADGASFRVFRAPVMSSLSYTATAKLDPGYQSTPSDNRYYASYGDARPFTTDDRSRTPRYFSDPDNRKPAPEYPIYSHFPPDDYIYEHPFSSISDIYSSSYDDHISTPTTTYSIVVSDDTSISMPELASDRSDFSNPNSPVDSGSPRMPVPSVPNTSPQPQAAYSSNFRNRTDAGYSTPRLSIPDSDPSLRSGPSNDNARLQTDSRRHPVFHQSEKVGTCLLAMVTPSGQVPYAESVLSVESEDDVHKIAKINAEYNAAASAMYGTLGRGSLSGPGLVPSMPHMATPIAVPRDSTARQIFTDAPLTSSPTQIRYADELQRSTSYRENRSSDGRPVYGSASYRPAVPPARHADDFLPPLNEWETKAEFHQLPGTAPIYHTNYTTRHHDLDVQVIEKQKTLIPVLCLYPLLRPVCTAHPRVRRSQRRC